MSRGSQAAPAGAGLGNPQQCQTGKPGAVGWGAGHTAFPGSVTPSAQPVARGSLAGERAISPKGQRLGEDSQPSLGAASLEERREGHLSKAATLTSWGRVLAGVGSSTSHRRRGPSPSPPAPPGAAPAVLSTSSPPLPHLGGQDSRFGPKAVLLAGAGIAGPQSRAPPSEAGPCLWLCSHRSWQEPPTYQRPRDSSLSPLGGSWSLATPGGASHGAPADSLLPGGQPPGAGVRPGTEAPPAGCRC